MEMRVDELCEKARKRAVQVAHELGGEDLSEDVNALPIVLTGRHSVSLLGCYSHIAANGLGRITIYLKPHKAHDEHELEDTVLHELAHALVHWLWPDAREPVHGARFLLVLSKLKEKNE